MKPDVIGVVHKFPSVFHGSEASSSNYPQKYDTSVWKREIEVAHPLDMSYDSMLTEDQGRALQNTADLLGVAVESLLVLRRDDQLQAMALLGSSLAHNHPPDTAPAGNTESALQSADLLIGGYPWLSISYRVHE